MFSRLVLLALISCTLPACDSVVPSLTQVLSGIDARRALECAAEGTAAGAAKCLGVRAMDEGLRLALNKAADLAEQAREAAGPGGADDMSDDDRGELASELDRALGELSAGVAKRQDPAT